MVGMYAHGEIVKDLIDLATTSCTKSRFKISSLSNFGEKLHAFYMYVRSHAEKVAESLNKFNIKRKFYTVSRIHLIHLNSISHLKADAKIVACFFFD